VLVALRKHPQGELLALVLDAEHRPISIIRHTVGLTGQTQPDLPMLRRLNSELRSFPLPAQIIPWKWSVFGSSKPGLSWRGKSRKNVTLC
jgi:hypothetical protein